MKTRHLQNRIAGILMGFAFLCGIVLVSGTTAQAQYDRDRVYRQDRQERRERHRDDRYRDRDGRWRDRDDRYRQGRVYRNDGYRNDGYRNDGYGNRGYGNNGGYGGYGNVYQIAQNQGYQAGLNTGASDAQRGQSYSPQRSHYYKEATDGYSSSYGNRESYKQAYRQAFVQGYQQGYQQYSRGGYGGYGRSGNTRSTAGSILGQILGGRP